MRALATIRWRRKDWRVCPWISVRSTVFSLMAVVATALIADRWVLANLERRGLVASEGWKRHNRVVLENQRRKDRFIGFPRPNHALSSGVRAWAGHPVSKSKSKSNRILVMGDSFVWNSPYLTLNHMWWRQLAIELQRRGYRDVEMIAAGTSGMSTHDELDLARYVVPEFQPDLILWGFVTNDPDERVVKQIHNSQLTLPIPGRIQVVLQQTVPRLFDLIQSRRGDKLAKSYLGPEYGYEYSDWLRRIHTGENFRLYEQTVHSVRDFLDDVKIPGLMVTLPEAPIADRFAFSYDTVVPLWGEAGIPVQNNLPGFVARFPHLDTDGPQALSWGINPADGHPGPRPTAILAHLTADRLEHDYATILGPKSAPDTEIRINDWLPFDLNVKPAEPEQFELTYPLTNEFLPTMPLEIPTALLALEQPQPLSEVRLSGTQLKSAQIWISTYDSIEQYDQQDWNDQGSQSGSDLVWHLPATLSARESSVVLLKAEFTGNDHHLILTLHRAASTGGTTEGPAKP